MIRGKTMLPILVSAVLVGLIGLSCTTTIPTTLPLPFRTPGARGLIVIVHGVGSRADWWPLDIERAFRDLEVPQDLWDIYRPDWHAMSLDALAAPRIGYKLGRELGDRIVARGDPYDVIHLIGHSAGCHVIQGIADAAEDSSVASIVFSTYLDPFVVKSVVRPFWGTRHLGASSDFAECYVTRDHSVPLTNSFLRQAYNVDLTPILPVVPGAADNYAHLWPIDYYLSSATSNDSLGILRSPSVLLGSNVTIQRAANLAVVLGEELPSGDVTVPE
jgi:pimeloyl-ACP methyl ester carboxylesterase